VNILTALAVSLVVTWVRGGTSLVTLAVQLTACAALGGWQGLLTFLAFILFLNGTIWLIPRLFFGVWWLTHLASATGASSAPPRATPLRAPQPIPGPNPAKPLPSGRSLATALAQRRAELLLDRNPS